MEVDRLTRQVSTKVGHRYRYISVPISDMDCSDCAVVLEHGLSRVDGVLSVEVNYPEKDIHITFDRQRTRKRTLEGRIRRLGYTIPISGLRQFLSQNQALFLSFLTGGFLLLGWLGERLFSLPDPLPLLAYLGAYLTGGLPLGWRILNQLLRERHFDTDQLMLAAAVGAAVVGEWVEGSLLLFLFSLGHALESRAMARAQHAILSLANYTPKTAQVRRDGELVILPIDEIEIGDQLHAAPGSKIPVDGIVVEGSSTMDQSAITGEPLPVDVSQGGEVYAGSINGDGALVVEARRLAKDSTLSRVIEMVRVAQAHKSKSQQFSERISRILVPSILILDAALILIPPLFGVPFRDSFLRAMTLLVAASPCALALGTPSAILAGVARAARNGVLVKGGAHLENVGRLSVVAFDKTGTITQGKPTVTDIIALAPNTREEVLRLAAAVEVRSAHPIAQAIASAARHRGLQVPDASEVQSETGIGIEANVNGHTVWVGKVSDAKFTSHHPQVDLRDQIDTLESQGKTIVGVLVQGRAAGLIAISDALRSETSSAINALKRLGVQNMIMLTGDQQPSAAHIAAQAGLDDFQAQLLPQDKVKFIQELLSKHGAVGMVGDGVNDAPALAAATVGIAMGGARTHVALETADVVLMADDLTKLPFAIGLGRKTYQIIRQNMFLALGVIFVLSILALTNLAGIGLAVLLHEGSTLIVVFNALRLLSYPSGIV
jgi:Cd2+/Zn2+-exporting ATPase